MSKRPLGWKANPTDMGKASVATRFHKRKNVIGLSNRWSKSVYVTRWFRSPWETVFYYSSFLVGAASILQGAFNFYYNNYSTRLALIFLFTGILYEISVLVWDKRRWTESPLLGSAPEDYYDVSDRAFKTRESRGLVHLPEVGTTPHLIDFPPDGLEISGYEYYSISDGIDFNRVAYSTDCEKWLLQANEIFFDEAFYNTQRKKLEKSILIDQGGETPQHLRLALELEARKQTANNQNFTNDKKISLRSLKIELGYNRPLARCAETSYFTSAVTNDSVAKQVIVASENRVKYDFREHYPSEFVQIPNVGKAHLIQPLDSCNRISNHIGCVVLALSSDSYPILCHQSKESRKYGNRLVVSGSGSLEISDLNRTRRYCETELFTFDKIIRFGMARELFEETGIVDQNRMNEEDFQNIWRFSKEVQFLSYYRDLQRGGLPIFVGFARLKVSYAEILNFKKRRETRVVRDIKHRIFDADQMLDFLNSFHTRRSGEISLPFSDQLFFMIRVLERPAAKTRFNLVCN